MARPKLEIDPIEVEKLAGFGCSINEIAAFFDCSRDTIEGRFSAIIQKGREQGKTRLRKLQWKSAENGNVVMQIWLGKQILDQADKSEDITPANADKNIAIKELSQKLLSLTQMQNEK